MSFYSAAILSFSFGFILIALLSLLRRKDVIALRFLLFSCFVAGWGFVSAYWFNQTCSLMLTERLMRIAHMFAVFIPITWTHFVFSFIDKKEPVKHFYLASYCVAVLLLFSCFTTVFMITPRTVGTWTYAVNPKFAYHVFTAYFFFLVTYCYYFLVRAFFCAVGEVREQLRCFVIATSFGFLGGSATFIMPYGYDFPVLLALVYLMPLYPIFMGVGLIKYGLFDSEKMMDIFRRDKLAAIGTMTASLYHEVKNPLFVIQGAAQSFLYNQPNQSYKEDADFVVQTRNAMNTIVGQSTRAIDIIKKFSNFTKYSSQHQPKLSSQKLCETLENVTLLLQHELQLQKVRLEVSLEPEDVEIVADARHLEEIFFNLIMNSCQALKTRGGVVKVHICLLQSKIRVLVEDNGPGISSAQLKKIFEPFYTTKEEGTGLGLYIVKQLVEKNRGKISVESKEGQGTRFVLEFSK